MRFFNESVVISDFYSQVVLTKRFIKKEVLAL